jgi:hypothetical protein
VGKSELPILFSSFNSTWACQKQLERIARARFSKTIRHVFSVYQERDALHAMTAFADASCCQWAVWLVSPLAAL